MRSISAASMGADMADINNDKRPDIFVTDMLPEPDERLKQVTTFESWDKHYHALQNGYYQYSRNASSQQWRWSFSELQTSRYRGNRLELGVYSSIWIMMV